MTFTTAFAGPIGFYNVGWYFGLWVVSGNVIAVLFVFLLCPETGGMTLEQVYYLFVDKFFMGLRKNFETDVQGLDIWTEKDKEKEVRRNEVVL